MLKVCKTIGKEQSLRFYVFWKVDDQKNKEKSRHNIWKKTEYIREVFFKNISKSRLHFRILLTL